MFDKKIYDLELKSKAKYNELLKDIDKNLYDMAIGEVSHSFRRKSIVPILFAFFGIVGISFTLYIYVHKHLLHLATVGVVILLFKAHSIDYIVSKIKNPYGIVETQKCSFCMNAVCTCSVEPKTESIHDIKHEDIPNEKPKEFLNQKETV